MVVIASQFLLLEPAVLQAAPRNRPNILFIIMDDVGIDQLKSFNPLAPQVTPVMETLVQKGISFNNCWMMPECSPSRACFFTGRYPLRTGVKAAILDYNLPSTQVSPFEMTTPRVLTNASYASALFGKFHLGGPDNNPAGFGAPAALGWNYFNGCMVGGPPYIDPTLGSQTTNQGSLSVRFSRGPDARRWLASRRANQHVCGQQPWRGLHGAGNHPGGRHSGAGCQRQFCDQYFGRHHNP